MKILFPIIIQWLLLLMVSSDLKAALQVVDVGSISAQWTTAKRDLLQQVLMEANQKTQIFRLVEQIQQIDAYLDRFGDPKKVNLRTLKNLYDMVSNLPISKTTEELERLLRTDYLYIDQPVYRTISPQIEVDGEVVAQRETDPFRPDLMARQSFSDYHELKEAAIAQRRQIDAQLQAALRELESASTSSEVQKIQAVITILNAQRAEITKEIHLAAVEASTRYYQNEVEARIARQAAHQERRAAYETGLRKNLTSFSLPSNPVLFER